MMRHISISLVLLVLGMGTASGMAGAQVPVAHVEGALEPDLRRGLVRVLGQRDGPPQSRWRGLERADKATERALTYLRSEGYYAATVRSRLGEDFTPVLEIEPGVAFRFSSIEVQFRSLESPTELERAFAPVLDLEVGDRVRARSVLDGRDRITARLRNSGYPEAGDGAYDITIDHATGQAEAQFDFETGPFVRLGYAQLAGRDAGLRPSYIERLAPYEIGDPASLQLLREYGARLSALDAVALADARLAPASSSPDQSNRPVLIRAEPTPRHTLSGAISWASDDGPGAIVSWGRRNLFGGAERLTLAARFAQRERSLSADIYAPHWAAYGQDLRVLTQLAEERTEAFDQDVFRLEGDIQRRFSRKWSASIGAGVQSGLIKDASGEQRLTTFIAPFGALYDGRDDVLDAREGFYLELEATPGWTTGDSDVRFVRNVAEARFYQSVGSDVLVALRARAGTVLGTTAERMPADLRFYAGGGGSVRGYAFQDLSPLAVSARTNAVEPIGGRSLTELSAEVRWRQSERFGFVTFLDAGQASDDVMPGLDDLRYGAGIGVRYYPGFGPVRVDLATPINPRERDDALQLYISIGQAF